MSDNQQLALNKLDQIRAMAQNVKVINQFIQVVGNKQAAMSYISSALLAVQNSKDLMECEPVTVWQCALRAATLRLSCDPALAQAHLVAFNEWKTKKKICTLILGWRGIKQMAMRTGKYRTINTNVIYEGQIWDEDQLTGLSKISGLRSSDRVIGYFNYFELFAGYGHALYMTVQEIEEHGHRYSKSYDHQNSRGDFDSKWHTDFDYMARKTVTRLNLLRNGFIDPVDAAILNEMGDDEELHEGETIDTTFEDVDPNEKPAPRTPQSEKKNMQDLGFDVDKKDAAPAHAHPATEPQTVAHPVEPSAVAEMITEDTGAPTAYDLACDVLDSKGKRYGDCSSEDLSAKTQWINKALNNPDASEEARAQNQGKLKAIKIILETRAANEQRHADQAG